MRGTTLFLCAWFAMAAILALVDGNICVFFGLLLVAKFILAVAAVLDD